ncbi:MAG: biotin--[acetyl-CoA-carboxylase] ligase [Bryobacteraceae bacterium]
MAFNLESVRARLPGRRIEWFASLGSTMTVAAQLSREGCDSGTVVGADRQVAGIGRHGHSWHSEADTGLYVSIVLRLPVSADLLPIVMLALGLATQEAIAEVAGLAADLRWPNDALIGGKKCAGILAQLEGGAIVAGIGLNVNHANFPAEIEPLATSLRIEDGHEISREDLLVALLNSIDGISKILVEHGSPAILKMFTRASSYADGRRVRVDQDGASIEGVTCGLDPAGFLVVRQDNGKEITILAGGVRPG